VVLRPILVAFDAEMAVGKDSAGGRHGEHPRVTRRFESFGLDPDGGVKLRPRADLDRLADAPVSLHAFRVLDAERRPAAVLDRRIGERPVSRFVLIAPAGEFVRLGSGLEVTGDPIFTVDVEHHFARLHDERHVARGKAFREVRIVGENPRAVSEAGNGRDDFEFQLAANVAKLRRVLEIVVGNPVENIQLVIGQHDAVVSRLRRPTQNRFDLRQVLGDLKVLLKVNPAQFQRFGGVSRGLRETADNETGQQQTQQSRHRWLPK
jgi:hypothetical protein